jgi:acetylornithine deacetylase/succinyl-diaminopimelate desuccinylase-like protein
MFQARLTFSGKDGWQSQVRFPFVRVGNDNVFNITASQGILGIEIRPIPQDAVGPIVDDAKAYCEKAGLEVVIVAAEDGISCNPSNPYLNLLCEAAREAFQQEPAIGRKLPATSARFAPMGQGVVWGQTGIGPHARDERHYLPSIEPYYQALHTLGLKLLGRPASS